MTKRSVEPSWLNSTQVIPGSARVGPQVKSDGDCLVLIYNKEGTNLGKRFVLDAGRGELSIGRTSDNDVSFDSESVSRKHCRVELRSDAWWILDLRSTNGTYANDEPVTEHKLRRGDQIKIGDTILKYLAGTDVETLYHEEIYRMTLVDGLTQAFNKRYLSEQVEKEMSRARRHGRPLSLILFDLDRFKTVNDTFGHLAGDYVLREVALLVRSRIRRDEIFARWGGEEFAVLLPETDLKGAASLAEELRANVAAHVFTFDGEHIPVTVSLGASQLDPAMREPDEFVSVTDRRLYEAKNGGRNRVVS